VTAIHSETNPVKIRVVLPPTEPAVVRTSLAGAAKQLGFKQQLGPSLTAVLDA